MADIISMNTPLTSVKPREARPDEARPDEARPNEARPKHSGNSGHLLSRRGTADVEQATCPGYSGVTDLTSTQPFSYDNPFSVSVVFKSHLLSAYFNDLNP